MNEEFDKEYFVIEHAVSSGNKLSTSPIYSWPEAVSEYHFYTNQFGKTKVRLLRCTVMIEEIDVI
jgi:hypothetical protein